MGVVAPEKKTIRSRTAVVGALRVAVAVISVVPDKVAPEVGMSMQTVMS